MTQWVSYDCLTWPEVAHLPRRCLLILPLGEGYDQNKLAEMLNFPEHIAILPAFPFGWRGSSLPVPQDVLKAYLTNLVSSLRDDGFVNIFILTPRGVNLDLGECQIVQPYQPSTVFH